jgi:lipopolysaccharide biosynthesis glycosyltransferase
METQMTSGKGERHVVTCADHRFAIGAWITIWSTYNHTPDNTNLRFHLLTTEPSAPEFAKMMELAKRWGMKLSIKRATADSIKKLPASERLPIYAYLRLLAPGILEGISRFLYLDSDLLVRSSVSPLYEMLGENTIAVAARDYYYDVLESGLKQTYSELNVEKNHPYFNSGVMMVNADAWRSREVSERAMEYLDRHAATVLHGDQDALNAILAGELKELDLSWNVQLGALEYFDRVGWPVERESLRSRKAELLRDPKIVHFIGPSKPWSDGLTIPYGGQYRKMIAESGWIPGHLVIPWKVGWLISAIRATIKRRLAR